jgi:choline dehydrogenase-like flavoprotein
MVARVLARSGHYEVLVLEKGPNYFSGLGDPAVRVSNLWSNDELAYQVRPSPIDQDPVLEPRTFRPSRAAGPRTHVGDVDNLPVTVGGATVHWNAMARRFREVDFAANSLLGGTSDRPAIAGTSYSDWPIAYRHLEPFYGLAEELLGVQGPARRGARGVVLNPNPLESWRSTPFPMPPGVPMYSNLIVADALERLGYHPVPAPVAVNSRPYRGRPACVDCAYCISYGCPINAKGGAIWILNDALASGRVELRSGSNVVHVEISSRRDRHGRARAEAVTYLDHDGHAHTEPADLVVLANSPIEAVRISIASGVGNGGDGGPDPRSAVPGTLEPSGLLGHNLMLHYPTVVGAILDRPLHAARGRNSTHSFDDFAGSGPSPAGFDAHLPRGGTVQMGAPGFPVREALVFPPTVYGQSHKDYMKQGLSLKSGISLALVGEDMPQQSNYVDLDPEVVDVFGQRVPRITYSNHSYELSASAFYAPKLLEIVEAIGGPGSAYPVASQGGGFLFPNSPVPEFKHIMGTHRMGTDPSASVTNPYGRYWAFSNLYHAGAGLFVTAPGFNPTLTIWALSYWLAAGILTGAAAADSFGDGSIDEHWPGLLEVVRRLDPNTMISRVLPT